MSKKHEITITVEGGSGAGKTVLANAIGSFLAHIVDEVTVVDDVRTDAPDRVSLKRMPNREVTIKTIKAKLPSYQAPEEPAVARYQPRIDDEIRVSQDQYDLECAAEDAPLPSDDDWVMGIRRAAIYRIRWGTGLNILVDHAWNGVAQTTVVPVAYAAAPAGSPGNLESFLKAREALAREFMKEWPRIEPSKWSKPIRSMTPEDLREALDLLKPSPSKPQSPLVPDDKRPW